MNFNLSPWNFFLVLGRTSVLVAFLPMLAEAQTPRTIRVGIALWISMVIYPTMPITVFHPSTLPELILAVGMEAIIGALFAIVIRVIFSAILLGAEWIDGEIGFQAAHQINPLSGAPSSPSTTLVLIIGAMIFWSLGTFENILIFWAQTFQILPPPVMSISPFTGDTFVQITSLLFKGALQIVTPIMLIMFLVSMAIGLMARALQGVNILVESFNIKLLAGLGCLLLILPTLIQLIQKQFDQIPEFWMALIRVLKNNP